MTKLGQRLEYLLDQQKVIEVEIEKKLKELILSSPNKKLTVSNFDYWTGATGSIEYFTPEYLTIVKNGEIENIMLENQFHQEPISTLQPFLLARLLKALDI